MEIIKESPIAVFILLITVITSYRAFEDTSLRYKFLFLPSVIDRNKQYYRFLTSGLIHADFYHLILNMLSFYFFAFPLERIMGHVPFLIFYILTLIASDIPSFFRHRNHSQYASLGASGAVSACILAVVMYMPNMMVGFMFIPMPGWLFAMLYIGYSYYASKKQYDNVAHDAHLWGAVSGIVLGMLMSENIRNGFFHWLGM